MVTNISTYNKFIELRQRYLEETGFMSNRIEAYKNESYRQIISMGEDVYHFLLDDLLNNRVDWLDALATIHGYDPVKEENWGDMTAMINDWRVYINE